MNEGDLKLGALFVTGDKAEGDVWELISFCTSPTVTLKNIKTGHEEDFGLGGLTSMGFKRLEVKE